jgi:hypothetical protein
LEKLRNFEAQIPQNQRKLSSPSVTFYGDFENNNIEYFEAKLQDDRVDVYLRSDTNTKGFYFWFSFYCLASGMVYFTIKNLKKPIKMAQEGAKIVCFNPTTKTFERVGTRF